MHLSPLNVELTPSRLTRSLHTILWKITTVRAFFSDIFTGQGNAKVAGLLIGGSLSQIYEGLSLISTFNAFGVEVLGFMEIAGVFLWRYAIMHTLWLLVLQENIVLWICSHLFIAEFNNYRWSAELMKFTTNIDCSVYSFFQFQYLYRFPILTKRWTTWMINRKIEQRR